MTPTLRPALVAGLILACTAAPAAAQDAMPETAHDALRMMLAMGGDEVRYDSTAPLGTDGFEIYGLSLSADDPAERPILIQHLVVEEIDWQPLLMGGAPAHATIRFDGLRIDLSAMPDTEMAQMILGPSLVGDAALTFRQSGSDFIIETLSLDMPDRGRFDIALGLGDATLAEMADDPMGSDSVRLLHLHMRYQDRGLAPLVAANSDGMIEAAVAELRMLGEEMPALTEAIVLPLIAFLEGMEVGGRALAIAVEPPEPLNLWEASMLMPEEMVGRLGLVITNE